MQVADVLAGLEAAKDLAFERAGLIAEKTQRLASVDGENDMVVRLSGLLVRELEDSAAFYSHHLLHRSAYVQFVS